MEKSIQVSEKDIKEVFDFWNEQNIMVHREITDRLEKCIKEATQIFGIEKIKVSIKNYSEIYYTDWYFFKYKFKLSAFLRGASLKGIGKVDKFSNEGEMWINFIEARNRKAKDEQKPNNNKCKKEINTDYIEKTYIEDVEKLNKEYNEIINKLKKVKYSIYLQTDHWKNFSEKAIANSHYKCKLCNKEKAKLNVHHKTYENRGHETYDDVIVLCEECHRLIHGIKET